MQIDLSNIVKYDSATNALTNGATTVLDIDNITGNLLTYDTATGQIEYDSVAITGIASMTFAQMENLTADQLLALAGMPVHISDVHCNAAGIGGVYIVRDSSPAGWAQISKPWYYAAVSDMPTGAAYTDFETFATGVGLYGTKYKYDGSVYRLNQNESVLAESLAVTKAAIVPATGWTVSSVTDNGGGSYTLNGSGAHSLTSAQCYDAGLVTYLPILSGTGWTTGLCLITNLPSANNITITKVSGGTGSTNAPTVGHPAEWIELDRVTLPPLNSRSKVSVDATFSGKGAASFDAYMGATLDNASTYGNSSESSTCLWFYATALSGFGTTLAHFRPAVSPSFANNGSASSQRTLYPRLKASQGGDSITTSALTTSTIDTSSAKTLKLMNGASVHNCRFWIDNYRITLKE